MVIARKIDVEHKYVLICDRKLPEPEQTVFYYKLPTLDEQYETMGSEVEYTRTADGEVKTVMKINKSGEVATLTSCIVKIVGLNDQDGNEVKWPADTAGRKKVLSQLDGAYRAELAEVIRTGTPLTEEEAKNSSPQLK